MLRKGNLAVFESSNISETGEECFKKNALLREKNAFSGTAFSRWAQEKKLSLQTALNYAKGN